MVQSETVTVTVTETPTELTINLNRANGAPGAVQLTGLLSRTDTDAGLGGKTVELWRSKDGGAFSKIKTTTTRTVGVPLPPIGAYLFNDTVEVGTYEWYVRFAGDTSYGESVSLTVSGTYAKIDTSLTIDVNPLAGASPLAMTVVAHLTRDDTGYGLSGKTVKLYRNKDGGAFSEIASKTTVDTSGGPGFAIFNHTLTIPADYGYYVYFAGDATFEGCEVSDGSTVLDGNGPEPEPVGYGPLLLLALLVMSQE